MLQVKNLTKEFKDVLAVNNISFIAEQGKIFGLLGPNGAGKTTTIRTILNIIKPSSGEVLINGRAVSSDIQNNTGYLPEERGLYKRSKVIDLLSYFGGIKGMSRSQALSSAKKWLEKLDITDYLDKKIIELSKGNQQKIQFIAAVIHDPQILILDEPFSGFDPINQQLIKDQIITFVKAGKIIILSTHQMETAEKLCHSIILLDKGKEVVSGNVAEVRKKYGTNAIKIEFEGDASFISSLSIVKSSEIYQNYAEIELTSKIQPNELLKVLLEKLEIKQFSLIEPTLNKIFIDVIKMSKN